MTPKIIKLKECFNADILYTMIKNKKKYLKEFKYEKKKGEYDLFKMAENYLLNSMNNEIEVSYNQVNGGRYYAEKGLSLQSLKKCIRHTISKDIYQDIDMKNSQPVILKYMCDKNNISCKYLNKYVFNRDEYLQTISDNVNQSKKIVLSIINGGVKDSLKSKLPFIKKLKTEMRNIHSELCKINEASFKKFQENKRNNGVKFNLKAKYINSLMCVKENEILLKMWEFLNKPSDCVLCFDGIMVKKNLDINLKKIEKYIKSTTGVNMKLKIKEMDGGIDIPEKEIIKYDYSLNIKKNEKKFKKQEFMLQEFVLYSDYKKLLGYTTFEDVVLKYLKSTLIIVNNGKSTVITKHKNVDWETNALNHYYLERKLRDIYESLNIKIITYNMLYNPYGKKSKENEEFNSKTISKILKDNIDQIPAVSKIEFVPYIDEPIKLYDSFNIFTGFPIQQELERDSNNIRDFTTTHMYKHMTSALCNGDKDIIKYMISWIAHIIQKPRERAGTNIVIQSQQGAGKDIFGKFIGLVIGSQYTMSFGDMQQFCQKHNSEQAGKLFIRLNEISDKGINLNNHNFLKNKTNEEYIRIEPKGLEPYNLKNYARYMLFTNNLNSIYVENDDRRYMLIQANNDNRNKYSYFAPIYKESTDLNILKSAFKYFKEYDISDFKPMEMPITDYKKKQIKNNISSVYLYLEELLSGEYEVGEHYLFMDSDKLEIKPLKHIKCNGVLLYKLYTKYCKDNGIYNKIQKKLFKQKIEEFGLKYKRFNIGNVRTRGFSFTKELFIKLMVLYTKDENYTLQ